MHSEYPIKIESGLYEIDKDYYAYKTGSFWVVVAHTLIMSPHWFTSDPDGGYAYFGNEKKAVEWARKFGYHYKTLKEACDY